VRNVFRENTTNFHDGRWSKVSTIDFAHHLDSLRLFCFGFVSFRIPTSYPAFPTIRTLLTMSRVTELSRGTFVWEGSFYLQMQRSLRGARSIAVAVVAAWDVVRSPSTVPLSIIILIVSGIIGDICNCRERPASESLHLKRMHRIHPREYQTGIRSPYSHAH